jgi:hypothetical protein
MEIIGNSGTHQSATRAVIGARIILHHSVRECTPDSEYYLVSLYDILTKIACIDPVVIVYND